MGTEVLRHKRNYKSFIAAYAMMGIQVGLVFGVFITYLSIVAPAAANYYSSFLGVGMLVGSALAAVAPKIGYKRIFLLTPIALIISMLVVINSTNTLVISVFTFIFILFICLYDILFAPFVAANTDDENRDSIINTTTIANIAGVIVGTFGGGPLIVWQMAQKLGISYTEASALSENIEAFNEVQLTAYTEAHRSTIIAFVAFTVLMIIPALLIRENKLDYTSEQEEKEHISIKSVLAPAPVIFAVFMFLLNVGAGLMTPYVSVYMLSIGISRDVVSILQAMQYVVILLGLFFLTPYITKKMGLIKGICVTCLLAVPFMLLCANGQYLGNAKIVLVGIGISMRYALYYVANPMMTSFQTVVVPRKYCAVYCSVLFALISLGTTLAGTLGGLWLFKQPNGYSVAYYIGAAFFAAGSILLMATLGRRYTQKAADADTQ